MNQSLVSEYQEFLNKKPFLTGSCSSWKLEEGVFWYTGENITLVRVDGNGNYQCYSMEIQK